MFRAWCLFVVGLTLFYVLRNDPSVGTFVSSLLANSVIYILPVWLLRLAYRRWQS